MSLVTIGLASELAADGIAANSLWPRTTIDTAAVRNILDPEMVSRSRTVEIMADAAISIISKPASVATGQCYVDEEVLAADGVTDFAAYQVDPSVDLHDLGSTSGWSGPVERRPVAAPQGARPHRPHPRIADKVLAPIVDEHERPRPTRKGLRHPWRGGVAEPAVSGGVRRRWSAL